MLKMKHIYIQKNRIIVVVLSLFILSACKNKNQSIQFENIPIVIDVDAIKGWVTLDSTNYDVHYIPLETNKNCLIGSISKSLIHENKIIIADYYRAMAVFVFDLNGKYLRKIDKRGRGPEEYISIDDVDVDSNGNIYIFDSWQEQFLIYDSACVYKNTIKVGSRIGSFCLMNEHIYYADLMNGEKIVANLAVFNVSKKNINYVIPSRELLDDYRYTKNSPFKFYRSPQKVYYSPMFSPIIYAIDETGVHPAIGLKNLKIPPKDVLLDWLRNREHQKYHSMSPQYFTETVNIYETEKYIYFTILMKPDILLLYDKVNGKFYNLNSLYKRVGISEMKGSTENSFWGIMNPHEINHEALLKRKKELKQWKEEDNPVIVFIDFDMSQLIKN